MRIAKLTLTIKNCNECIYVAHDTLTKTTRTGEKLRNGWGLFCGKKKSKKGKLALLTKSNSFFFDKIHLPHWCPLLDPNNGFEESTSKIRNIQI